jgi:transposase-like protein
MINLKGHRFKKDLILTSARWHLAYPLSYRNLAEIMTERGVDKIDQTTDSLLIAQRDKKGYATLFQESDSAARPPRQKRRQFGVSATLLFDGFPL